MGFRVMMGLGLLWLACTALWWALKWQSPAQYSGPWPDETWGSYASWAMGVAAGLVMLMGAFILPFLLLFGLFRLRAWGGLRWGCVLVLWVAACAQAAYLVALLSGATS